MNKGMVVAEAEAEAQAEAQAQARIVTRELDYIADPYKRSMEMGDACARFFTCRTGMSNLGLNSGIKTQEWIDSEPPCHVRLWQ